MKGLKQSKADHQAKQIAALVNVVNHLMQEVDHLRNLSVGTLETIKCMPDYDEAIAKLQEKAKENESE
jgi:regulator of RNase E activity RraA